jgi:hypothetical protein
MHKALLEALRHREQEILRYLAFVGPALAGFIWLLSLEYEKNAWAFIVGTVAILFGTQFAPARRNILQITHFTPCARLNKMI